MQRSFVRVAIIGVVALTLAACTAVRFGYSQGPGLAYWWLDRYLDFDRSQKPQVKRAIDEWFTWHRSTQLPDYVALLTRGQVEVADAVTPAQACQWIETIKLRIDAGFDHALPALAEAVRALTPKQLEHLERKYEKNTKEYKSDYLQPTARERHRAQVERLSDRAQMLYGRLNDSQRDRIEQLTAESPFDPQAWLVERQQRQQDTLQALRTLSAEHASAEDASVVLKRLYEQTFHSPREPYRQYQQALERFNCDFAAQVHNLSTPRQRAEASKRLKGWEEDARILSGEDG